MSKGFNLGEYLKGSGPMRASAPTEDGGGVSELNTEREELRYLPLDLIDPDPANFYSLEGLDELAGSIELIGLQQPLRVRPASTSSGAGAPPSPRGEGRTAMRYIVVSGHRRRAALMLIRDGDGEQFAPGGCFAKGVPCLVDYGEASDAMRELRLIFANSSTRVMTSAEQSKQAERVTELLYELKEQGVEFPGRMRDHVAEACNLSRSKVGRLQAIRANLIPGFLAEYDAGRINESVAYRLSQETQYVQTMIDAKCGPILRGATREDVDRWIAQVRALDMLQVTEYEGKRDDPSVTSVRTGDSSLSQRELGASDGANKAIDGLKRYLEGRAEEDRQFRKLLELAADSLILHSFASGALPIRRDSVDMLRLDLRSAGIDDTVTDWMGDNKGLTIRKCGTVEKYFATWSEVYDALAAIAITRWRRELVDEKHAKRATARVAPTENISPAWFGGEPESEGRYYARIDMGDGGTHEAVGEYRGGSWSVFGGPLYENIKVVCWWPLPERG